MFIINITRLRRTLITCIVFIPLYSLCQNVNYHSGVAFDLNSTITGNHIYEASDNIRLLPGFSYIPTSNETFIAKINTNSYSSVNYLTTPFSSDDRDLDINLAVGSINGYLNVNSWGLATYTISLILPPGTNNMEPSISLQYNSMIDNGILGIGWDIAGLSSINRDNLDIYHDGIVKGIEMSANDKFSIDGNRLNLTNGIYGSDGSEYHTEKETFSKITANGTNGKGPDWFLVETKDGRKLYYGYTTDSKVLIPGTSGVYNWLLSKVEDNQGNFIEYNYITENNAVYINEIKYTGNSKTGLTPYNVIKFKYGKRSDVNTIYILGAAVRKELLLTEIDMTSDGNTSHKYIFDYYDGDLTHDHSTILYSYLYQISEFGDDNTKYNPTLFRYNQVESLGPENPYSQSIGDYVEGNYPASSDPINVSRIGAGTQIFTGDFNGDGWEDYVTLNNSWTGPIEADPYAWVSGKAIIQMSLSDADGLHSMYLNEFFPAINSVSGYSISDLRVGDFNGDGMDDLIFKYNNFDHANLYDGNNDGTYKIYLLLATGTRTNMTDYFSLYDLSTNTGIGSFPFQYTWSGISDIKVSDYNGDSKAECLIIENNTTEQICTLVSYPDYSYTFNINMNGTVESWSSDPFPLQFIAGDYNGDGKSELIAFDVDGCKIFDPFASTSLIYESSYPKYRYNHNYFYQGDFNGDGKSDLLSYSSDEGWKILYFNGNAFVISDSPVINYIPSTYNDNVTFAFDYNQDGKTDIVDIYGGSSGDKMETYLSMGNNIFVYAGGPIIGNTDIKDYHFGDFNGDGNIDFSYIYYEIVHPPEPNQDYEDAYQAIYYSFTGNKNKALIKSITNGFNEKTELTYRPLYYREISGQDIYSVLINNDPSGYPVSNFTSSEFYITSVKNSDGLGDFVSENISYEDALIERTGRGFLGFKKIKKIFSTGEVLIEKYELLNDISLLVQNEKIIEKPEGTVVEKTTYDNNIYTTIGNGFFLYNSQVDYVNYLEGTNISIFNTYNYTDIQYGNLTSSKKEYTNDNASITTCYKYFQAGSWCPSKIQDQTILYERTHQSSYTKKITYDYYATGDYIGLPKSIINNPDLTNKLTTTFSVYDPYGNLLQKDISAPDIEPRSTSCLFDARGRFKIQITNELSQISSDEIEYDGNYGSVTKIKDIKGLYTQYQYDGFGRLNRVIPSVGNEINISLAWNTATANDALFYRSITQTGNAPLTEYFDSKQRCVQKATKGFLGDDIYSEISYNEEGMIDEISEQHFLSASTINRTVFSYDNYYRLKTIVSPTENYQLDYSLIQNKYNSTATNNLTGQTTTQVINSLGEVTQINEEENVIKYYYNSGGQIKQIDVGDVSTTITYDEYGFQNSLTDPDAGTSTYKYNSLGELTYQKDDLQNEYQVTYDKTGRVLTVTSPEGTTIYEYDTETNGLGELASVENPNDIKYSYKYDNFGRIWRETEDIEGQIFNTDFEYNSNNKLFKITYPSLFSVKQYYDSYGYLRSVRRGDNSSLIYINQEVNALGEVEQYAYGNNITTYNTYDDLHHKLTSMLASNSSGSAIFNYSYGYDPSSFMLNSRTDIINDLSETFGYDNYDRLTNITGLNGLPSSLIIYDPNGNILSNTSVGNYQYGDDAGVHAVTSITDNTTISHNPQDITYTSFNKVESINENGFDMTFTYGPDYERKKVVLSGDDGGTLLSTKFYLLNYEKEIKGSDTRELHYINGSDGLAAIFEIKNGVDETMYYIHKDHLGSIIGATDQGGSIVPATLASYDAWGNLRDPETWQLYSTPLPDLFFGRGFTGHEHLEEFDLINMNGRLYDPVIGRFLSPDIYNQTPDFSQTYNRYSYCLNNPLNYIDISGYQAEDSYDNYDGIIIHINIIPEGYFDNFNGPIGPPEDPVTHNDLDLDKIQPLPLDELLIPDVIPVELEPYHLDYSSLDLSSPPDDYDYDSSPEYSFTEDAAEGPSEDYDDYYMAEMDEAAGANSWWSTIPVIGPAFVAGNYLNQGNYFDATRWTLLGIADALSLGSISEYKAVSTSLVISTSSKANNLSIRSDIVLIGGRSGQYVKNLTGPANSVVKGGRKGIIFITDKAGKVILDITKDRVKTVIPGRGFGPKTAPTQDQLDLIYKLWGE